MGDVGDYWRAAKEDRRKQRDKHTVSCPNCPPNRSATRLWPGQTCRVCGYTDPRKKGEKPKRSTSHQNNDGKGRDPSFDIQF